MYARLLVRSLLSLALYSGRCTDDGGGGGGGGQLYPGRAYNRTRKKKRFKTMDIAVLIKTRFEFTGF